MEGNTYRLHTVLLGVTYQDPDRRKAVNLMLTPPQRHNKVTQKIATAYSQSLKLVH